MGSDSLADAQNCLVVNQKKPVKKNLTPTSVFYSPSPQV